MGESKDKIDSNESKAEGIDTEKNLNDNKDNAKNNNEFDNDLNSKNNSKVDSNSENLNYQGSSNSSESYDNQVNSAQNMKNEIDELTDRYKRLLAEFENFKKRSQKERDNLYGLITGDVLSAILPIMDNLENASKAKTEDTNYQEGVKMVSNQLAEALKKLGLQEIEAVGTTFDPELHEAVSHIEDNSKGEKEIVEEYRKGYKIGNKVIRHSMVIVAN